MNHNEIKFTYNLTHCYLEVARGILTPIYHNTIDQKTFLKQYGSESIANVVFSVISITVIYSYLAIDSFVNYQLYRKWERRHDGSNISQRLLNILGDEQDFEAIRLNKKTRELGDRIKTFCEIVGYKKPHEKIPLVWKDSNELVKLSRHFFVHPKPDNTHFQKNAYRIFNETKSGKYVHVAEEIIKFFHDQSMSQPPIWLMRNTLFKFKGIDMLVGINNIENDKK